jgi:branched-chain amino acid transport system ATP-binding protein
MLRHRWPGERWEGEYPISTAQYGVNMAQGLLTHLKHPITVEPIYCPVRRRRTAPAVMHRPGCAAAMLVVQNIHKRFGGLAAVDDTSFDIAQGSITSLIGPNGAGKTTLFNIISGLLRPSAGTVLFKGTDITGWSPQRIARAGMGRTFQNVRLFQNLNAIENVIAARFCRTNSSLLEALLFLPRDRRVRQRSREVAEELLDWIGIAAHRFLMPRELPYGDQRRLEIARALATEPELLMLDEPSAGMSHLEAQELMDLGDCGNAVRRSCLLSII